MKILLNPIVLAVIVVLFFVGGFGFGLWKIGYFDPNTYKSPKVELAKKEAKEQAKEEHFEKINLEVLQKLSVELDRASKDLKQKETLLNERDAALQKREEELNLEKASLENIRKSIETMRADFDAQLALVETTQEGNIQKLSKLYSVMDISNAAKMIGGMSDIQSVQILRTMKDAKSAKILEQWLAQPETAEKAKRVSELIRLNQPAPPEGSETNP